MQLVFRNIDDCWTAKRLSSLISLLSVIVGAGALLGFLVGSPKAVFIVVMVKIAWLIAGFLRLGLWATFYGLFILSASLMAAGGDYALSIWMAFGGACLIVGFTKIKEEQQSVDHE